MKSKTYNGEVRSSEKDFEALQLGAFATPGLPLAQGPVCLTAESGFKGEVSLQDSSPSLEKHALSPSAVLRIDSVEGRERGDFGRSEGITISRTSGSEH
jgi:hypothetical protein